MIVSEVPGTTRDSVDVRFEKEGKTLIVIDTAGVRKKRHMVTDDIAFYSFHRAERSIRRADVVLMLIDATEPVSEPDKKLARYIAEQFKPVVLVVNKWDLAKQKLQEQSKAQGGKFDDHGIMEEYREYLDAELRHVDYSPIAFVTAKEGKNVQQVLDLSQHLFNQANTRVHDAPAQRGGAPDHGGAPPQHAVRRSGADLLRDADGRGAADDRAVREQPRLHRRDVPAVHGEPLPRAAAVRGGADPAGGPRAAARARSRGWKTPTSRGACRARATAIDHARGEMNAKAPRTPREEAPRGRERGSRRLRSR